MKNLFSPLLLASLLAFSLPAVSQITGSAYEPQLAELTLEGRVSLNSIFAANPTSLAIPADVLMQLQTGQLELRGRIEFNRAARVLRLWQFIVPAGTPLPLPQSPAVDAPNVAISTDLHVEQIRWHQFNLSATGQVRQVVAILGRTLAKFTRVGPNEGETGLISFGFDNNDPSRLNFLTVHYPGEITAVIQQVNTSIRLEPAPLKAGQ